jgi:hypothetical protein
MRKARLVVDTNQARSIPLTFRLRPRAGVVVAGLTLPPYILGEILLRGQAPRSETLARLRSHGSRIGLEPLVVAEQLATKSAAEIATFEPFPSLSDPLHALYRSLLHEDGPTLSPGADNWAHQVKSARLALSARFQSQSADARSQAKIGKVRRLSTFTEAMKAEGTLKSFVMSLLSSNGQRKMLVSEPETLYQAVMSNVFLRHFFHTWLFYTISLSSEASPQTDE